MQYRKKLIVPLAIPLVILVGIASLTQLTKQSQDIRQQAAGSSRTDIDFPITKKVMIIWYNPIIESMGGRRINDIYGWNDPHVLEAQFISDINTVSGGFANYIISERHDNIDDFPVFTDGYDYTDEEWLACQADSTKCHRTAHSDYNVILDSFDVCEKRNQGLIDELWIWGSGDVGNLYEAVMAGPNAFNTNGPVIINTSCNKQIHIMTFNPSRLVQEMLESLGHRVEGTLKYVFNEDPRRSPYPHNTDWGKFAIWDKVAPGEAGCGWMHFPHNGTSDYNWNNQAYASTNCEDWLNYPNFTGFRETINCSRWNCYGYDFKKWWFSHLPKYLGVTNGKLNNWWRYILDYEDSIPKIEPIEDLTENNSSMWGCIAENGSCEVSDNTQKKILGLTSLKFTTTSFMDTSIYYPLTNLDISLFDAVFFWAWAENTNESKFQNNSPWIILSDDNGNYFKYTSNSPKMNNAIGNWQQFIIPLAGDSTWTRSASGSATLSDVDRIEIHNDTWGYNGYTIYFDGLGFSPNIPVPSQTVSPIPTLSPSPIPTPSPIFTLDDIKILIENYLGINDSNYYPQEDKINMLDAGWVVRWME